MNKPNPNDPSLIDVYDDVTGEYVTTIEGPGEPTSDPMTGQIIPPLDVDPNAGQGSISRAFFGEAPPEDPNATSDPRRPGVTTVTHVRGSGGAPSLQMGSADLETAEAIKPAFLTPGMADMLEQPSAGGMVESQRVSKGLAPERVTELEGLLGGAMADQRMAGEADLEGFDAATSNKRQTFVKMGVEISQARAAQAIEAKQNAARRAKVEATLSQWAAFEPDRNKAYPTGWSKVAVFLGAVAGGMLQGLNGGSNPVLDALFKHLDDSVRQQRETQSNQIKELGRQIGSIEAAEDLWRAKQKEIGLKEIESRLLGQELKVAPAQREAMRRRFASEITKDYVNAISKLDRDLAIEQQYIAPSAGIPNTSGAMLDQALKGIAMRRGYNPRTQLPKIRAEWVDWNKAFRDMAPGRQAIQAAMNAIEKYKETGDVAGFGFIDSKLPDILVGKDALQTRQLIGQAVAGYLKEVSGAAVSEPEFKRTEGYLLSKDADYDTVNQGLNQLMARYTAIDSEQRATEPDFWELRQLMKSQNAASDMRQSRGYQEQESLGQEEPDPVAIGPHARIARVHNNPGNLIWVKGMGEEEKGEPKEGGGYWRKFSSVAEGMRGLVKQVQKDQQRGLNLRQFVEKYAPSTDGNDVDSYVRFLSRKTGADEETMLSDISPSALAFAIAEKESGSTPAR